MGEAFGSRGSAAEEREIGAKEMSRPEHLRDQHWRWAEEAVVSLDRRTPSWSSDRGGDAGEQGA